MNLRIDKSYKYHRKTKNRPRKKNAFDSAIFNWKHFRHFYWQTVQLEYIFTILAKPKKKQQINSILWFYPEIYICLGQSLHGFISTKCCHCMISNRAVNAKSIINLISKHTFEIKFSHVHTVSISKYSRWSLRSEERERKRTR